MACSGDNVIYGLAGASRLICHPRSPIWSAIAKISNRWVRRYPQRLISQEVFHRWLQPGFNHASSRGDVGKAHIADGPGLFISRPGCGYPPDAYRQVSG